MKTNLQSVIALCAAPLLAGCVSSGGGETMDTEPVFMPDMFPQETYQANPVMDASFGALLNNVRLDAGAGPVTYNALLDQAAQVHADDMVANDYFSHYDKDGKTVAARVTATGYEWRKVAENIGRRQTSEEHVLSAWVNSPAHQEAQTDPAYEHFGLARSGTGRQTKWVLVLADPR